MSRGDSPETSVILTTAETRIEPSGRRLRVSIRVSARWTACRQLTIWYVMTAPNKARQNLLFLKNMYGDGKELC